MRGQDSRELLFGGACLLLAALVLSCPYMSLEYVDKGHDGLFHLNRIEGIKEGILVGEFPVRIHGYQMNGYGTADGVMYPELLLYLPALLRIAGVPVELSWNLYWIFVSALGMVTAWYGYSIWTGSMRSGAIAAVLHNSAFLYLMFFGQNAGDLPAVWAFPLAAGAMFAVLQGQDGARYWLAFVIGFTIISQSHVITTLFLGLLAVSCCIMFHDAFRDESRRQAIFKALAFSLLLNVWQFVPFLYFYETIAFHINHPPLVSSLHQVTSGWRAIVGSQFYLGAPIVFFTAFFLWKKPLGRHKGFLFSVLCCAVLVSMISHRFPWEAIEQGLPGGSFLPNFQFAHRFLPLGILFLCRYLGQFLADSIKPSRGIFLACIGIASCAFGVYSQAHFPKYWGDERIVGIGMYRSIEKLPSYTTKDAYLQEDYLYADVVFHEMRNREGNIPGPDDFYSDASIYNTKKQGTTISFSYEASKDSVAQMPLFYWPGYVAVDGTGKELAVRSGEHRFMEILLPQGAGTVRVHYAGLWFFRLFDAISLVSLLAFVFLCRRKREKCLCSPYIS